MRKKLKVATLRVVAYDVFCPHCDEAQGNPIDGSMMWETTYPWKRTQTCVDCGEKFALPRKLATSDRCE